MDVFTLHIYMFFLDVQKVYGSLWCDGLWLKLWDKREGVVYKCMKYLKVQCF